MTPTRELALQIFRECKKFCKPLNLRVVCVYGGTGISEQVSGDLQWATNGVQTLCSDILFSIVLETFHPLRPSVSKNAPQHPHNIELGSGGNKTTSWALCSFFFSFQLFFLSSFIQIAELKRGAEIIVCTPGRMIDMLTANNGEK